MEALFANSDIEIVHFDDLDGVRYFYAYTDKMHQRNTYVEFYEWEIEEGNPNEFEYETMVNVYALQSTSTYSFTLFFDDRPLVAPLLIKAIIKEAVNLIESTDPPAVFHLLKHASISAISSKRKFGFCQLDDQDLQVRDKINHIHNLIKQRHTQQN